MAQFFLTNKAVDDLSNIWNYTYDTWSEIQADKYYQQLIDACNEIAKKPDQGKKYEGVRASLFGLKSGRHIIFYRLIDPNKVEITRILHDRMNLQRRIKE